MPCGRVSLQYTDRKQSLQQTLADPNLSKTYRNKNTSTHQYAKSLATRNLILDTTAKLMLDEGYAAVSTRQVAKEAELKAPLVCYHYTTTDDLAAGAGRGFASSDEITNSHTFRDKDQYDEQLPPATERYTLTADELQGQSAKLNGQSLALTDADQIPALKGVKKSSGTVTLAPASMTFFAAPRANNSACR